MNEGTRLIRVSVELLDSFGTRTADGRSMSAEWGEPTGHCPDGDEYIYEPTFTVTDDGWLDGVRAQAAATARAEVARKVRELRPPDRFVALDGTWEQGVSERAVLAIVDAAPELPRMSGNVVSANRIAVTEARDE